MTFWLWYCGVGAGAGVLAGLMGVGGGVVIVPALVVLFRMQQFPEGHIQHLAVGTSLACILFTSLSSLRAHHHRGAVDWRIVRRISPGIVIGTLAGSVVASQVSTRVLQGIFVIFLYYVIIQMLVKMKVRPSRELPGGGGIALAGGVIGGISSLVGIGGGTMTVPFLVWCTTTMHTAIGTSAAVGFPIALAGTVGNIATGHGVPNLPPFSLGYVHLPSLAGIAFASSLTAPLGARITHSLPVPTLRKGFALFLLVVNTRLLIGLW
jgi:uncharacterized membrane protein YfcA